MGTNTKIAKSAGVIGLGTIISRVLGFVRDVVIARYFGTAVYAQAFVVSFRIPNLLRDLVAEGATNAALVPVLSEYRARNTEEKFWQLVSSIFKIVSIILIFVTIAGILLSPIIVRIIAPGFMSQPQKLEITVILTKILFPFIFFMGLVAFTTGVLNARRNFAIASFGQGIINLSMIACVIFLFGRLEKPIYGLALGVLLGGFIQAILQCLPLLKAGLKLKFNSLDVPYEAKRMGILLIPRVIGSCIYQLNVFVDTMLASLAGIVGEGGVAALYYSNRLIQFPLAIFGISIAQAALPTMSTQAATNSVDELRQTLSFSLRQVFLIMIPAGFGLMVLGGPIIQLLFERGEFNAYSTHITNTALFYYSFGLFAYAGVKILTSCFYSMQDTKTPVKIAGLCLILNVILNITLMWPLKIGGLALATSVSSSINFFILAHILRKRLGRIDGKRIFIGFMKVVIASFAMAWSGLSIFNKLNHLFFYTGKLEKLIVLLATISISMLVFFVACLILRVEETRKILKWISRKS